MKRHIAWVAALGIVLAIGCRPTEQSLGTIHGRVLSPNGNPVRGARLALDGPSGRMALTDVSGAFQLVAEHGGHDLYAFHSASDTATVVQVHVNGDSEEVGDVVLEDCDVVILPTDGDGTDPGPAPCDWEEPPPPNADVHIDSFVADYADGSLDSYGLWVFGEDIDQMMFVDGLFAGDFTDGGSATYSVEDAVPWDGDIHFGAFLWEEYGYYYVLSSGEFTVTVGDANGDGNSDFDIVGTDLVLHYMHWDGTTDASYTLTIGSAQLAGETWTWEEPDPPTEDIVLDPFNATWTDIMLLQDCAPDGGDLLFVYAWDEEAVADVFLGISVNDLTLPGSSDLLGWLAGGTTDGFASYYGADGTAGWFYDLNHITVATAGGIAVGDALTLSLSDGQFDYFGGGVVVGPEPEPVPLDGGGDPPEVEFHLFINSGDLSGEVVDGYGDGPVEPLEG